MSANKAAGGVPASTAPGAGRQAGRPYAGSAVIHSAVASSPQRGFQTIEETTTPATAVQLPRRCRRCLGTPGVSGKSGEVTGWPDLPPSHSREDAKRKLTNQCFGNSGTLGDVRAHI